MTRLACRRATACAAALVALGGAARAEASDPVSVYTAAVRVDMFPNDASATSVAIHGAFILLQADGSYSAPQCGYMYFQCAAGSETMCRLQWNDLRAVGMAATTCAGFGALRVAATATIRSEATPLAAPDTWDLGIGVTTGVSVGGQCQPAKALSCQPGPATGGSGGSTGSGGTSGAAGSVGTSGTAGSVGTSGAAGTSGTGGTTGTSGTTGGTASTGTGTGGGGEVLASRAPGWCAVAAGVDPRAGVAAAALLIAAAVLRRRRRR